MERLVCGSDNVRLKSGVVNRMFLPSDATLFEGLVGGHGQRQGAWRFVQGSKKALAKRLWRFALRAPAALSRSSDTLSPMPKKKADPILRGVLPGGVFFGDFYLADICVFRERVVID